MTATQVHLTERGETVVISKKKKGLHLGSDFDFFQFPLIFVTTSQEGPSILKSCAHRSFSFTRNNLQAFATHPHSLGDPLLGRDPWFKKHWFKTKISNQVNVSIQRVKDGSPNISFGEWKTTTGPVSKF